MCKNEKKGTKRAAASNKIWVKQSIHKVCGFRVTNLSFAGTCEGGDTHTDLKTYGLQI